MDASGEQRSPVDGQKEWLVRFRTLFGNRSNDYVEFLKACRCFSEADWKKNLKHAINRTLNDQCQVYDDTMLVIADAEEQKSESFALVDTAIRYIPTSIEILKGITSLYLSDLDIRSLPVEISTISSLENLVVSKCPLYEFPSWLSRLTGLRTLKITRCRLMEVSGDIDGCTMLETLCLCYNHITELPKSIQGMKRLERLELDANDLQIDWQQGAFPSLIVLSIAETRERNIPQDVFSRLVSINCRDCRGILLPASFGQDVVFVDFSWCDLRSLPQGLDKATNLCYLNLSGNRYVDVGHPALSGLAKDVRLILSHKVVEM